MKNRSRSACHRLAGALAVMAALAAGQPATAFDTGHHADLTHDAMQDQGFTPASIGIAQVANWLTDYDDKDVTSPIRQHTSKLHFNNLITTQQLSNYWANFVINTHQAIQQAARQNQPLRALVLMGISLHALQDFYTHSNWVESHPSIGDSFRTETWFSSPPQASNLYTGLAGPTTERQASPHPHHGGYSDGLSKDSYMKATWDQAYTFAYVASREWINALRIWAEQANPGFWQRVKATRISERELRQDLTALHHLSKWVWDGKHDGHWKGKGSGYRDGFYTAVLDWISRPESSIVREFRQGKAYLAISDGLSGDRAPTVPIPQVPPLPLHHQAVIIRTLQVSESSPQITEASDPAAQPPATFARVSIQGQSFIETVQRNQTSFRPHWTTIKFIPTNVDSVRVDYQLIHEDTHSEINDSVLSHVRGQPLRFAIDISTATLSGDGHGRLGRPAITINGNAGISGNADDRPGVTLAVAVKPLVPARDCRLSACPGRPGPAAASRVPRHDAPRVP